MSHYYSKGHTIVGEYPPRIVCFVCGLEGPADYPLYVAPHGFSAVKSQPFFPFLKELEPPPGCRRPGDDNSCVFSCRQCYSALMKQWDDNEQGGVTTDKRVYWTKRCAGLRILDPDQQLAINKRECSKYSLPSVSVSTCPAGSRSRPSTVTSLSWKDPMGPPVTSASVPVSQDTDNDSALDLSSGSRGRETMKSCSSAMSHISAVSHHSSYMSEGAGSSTDILDLTLPDKNATTEVCYVCGDEFKKGILSFIHTRPVSRNPHFPSLVHHPRPPRSRPMDSAGRVQACDECNADLLTQWTKFDEEKLAHVDRKYILRKRHTPIVDTTTFVCYICALDYNSSSLRLLYCRSNSENEPYYPQVEQQRPPPGASPISSGGMVQVCSHCYKCTREKYSGMVSSLGPEPPPKKRKSSRAASVPEIIAEIDHSEEDGKLSPADIECPLCRRKYTVHSFKFLHSQGPPLGGLPYFPFLRTLPRLNDEVGHLCDEDSQGRVRACQACHNSLINQWTAYQRDAAPIDERTYSYQSLVGQMSSGRVTPGGDLTTRVSARATATPTSGRSLHSPGAGGSVASAPTAVKPLSVVDKVSSEQRPRSNSNPHSPRIPSHMTGVSGPPPTCHSPISVHSATSADHAPTNKHNTSSFYCFLCGFHSELSFARMLYSEPQGKKAPYFPFMKDHSPKPRAEILRDDGTALVCTFCYHSVMDQWQRYQDNRSSLSASERQYNINDYVCFVCQVKTYRKRIRALRVHDFPFFRQHKPARGTITMENGDMAAVCLDCFENLKNQFVEAAKYGIPIEKRQYNWMVVPPPPEDCVQLITPKERLDKQIISLPSGDVANDPLKKPQTSSNQQSKDAVHSPQKPAVTKAKEQAQPPPPITIPSSSSSAVFQPLKVPPFHPTVVSSQHMLPLSTGLMVPPLSSLSSIPPPLTSLSSYPPNPGILHHQGLLNTLNPIRLEADPLYRAQIESYTAAAAAANSLSNLTQAALMPSLNPTLLGHFLPPNLPTSLAASPRPAPRASPRPPSKGPASGNADAPLTSLPGREGLLLHALHDTQDGLHTPLYSVKEDLVPTPHHVSPVLVITIRIDINLATLLH